MEYCCHLDSEGNSCPNKADVRIYPLPVRFDDYMEVCSEHVKAFIENFPDNKMERL